MWCNSCWYATNSDTGVAAPHDGGNVDSDDLERAVEEAREEMSEQVYWSDT